MTPEELHHHDRVLSCTRSRTRHGIRSRPIAPRDDAALGSDNRLGLGSHSRVCCYTLDRRSHHGPAKDVAKCSTLGICRYAVTREPPDIPSSLPTTRFSVPDIHHALSLPPRQLDSSLPCQSSCRLSSFLELRSRSRVLLSFEPVASTDIPNQRLCRRLRYIWITKASSSRSR